MPQFLVTVPTPGTPVQLASIMAPGTAAPQPQFARIMHIVARKGLAGLNAGQANTGIVAIGHSSVANNQPVTFNPGDERVYLTPSGMSIDMTRWYVDAVNAGDGVVVIYE